MNDTSTSRSERYDSSDVNEQHDDRHTVRTYVADMLALERHIAQPLARQLDSDDSAKVSEAFDLIATIKAKTEVHATALESLLERIGGDNASPVKSAITQLLGAGAAAVNSVRKTKVSKSLRDDYTALALASVSYTMLHTTALGLGDSATAALAKQHLDDYAPIIIDIARTIPTVVLEELRLDGENVQVSAAEVATANTQASWK